MNSKIVIRPETETDVSSITEVTISAFKTLKSSNHTEQFIILALRAANALTVSLVAEMDGQIVGHIAFSPISITDSSRNWYGLGPVSVLPIYQRRGIDTAPHLRLLSREYPRKSFLPYLLMRLHQFAAAFANTDDIAS
jgi:putative acetyltransferase